MKMTESLDDLFNTIQLTEQESEAQHQHLANLKKKIADSEKEIKEVEKICSSIRQNSSEMAKKLSYREVSLKSLTIRKEILGERIKELKSENEILKRTEEELKVHLKSIREQFFSDAAQFMKEFRCSLQQSEMDTHGLNDDSVNEERSYPPEIQPNNDGKNDEYMSELEGIDTSLFDADF
ncbi:coiled-coil domain-containing protein 172-like [Stegodyphus dumicola]|uniref:coiled-coil domain-containing protein 172-like n=1 Tax=Stegodyphus dumicola TaxID=202533 RepID=UPI0015A84258|nr:coiled-coil domain-containing protein 172-like [Stegodyphus dumicola]